MFEELQKTFEINDLKNEDTVSKTEINLGSSKYSYFAENFYNEKPSKASNEEPHNSPRLKSKRPLENLIFTFKSNCQQNKNNEYIKNSLEVNKGKTINKGNNNNNEDEKNVRHSMIHSFGKIKLEEKIMNENLIEMNIILKEPVNYSFSFKVSKYIKISMVKTKILEKLKEENAKLFKKMNTNSFILMRKHFILKENQTIMESGIENKENLYILMKLNMDDKVDKKKKEGN